MFGFIFDIIQYFVDWFNLLIWLYGLLAILFLVGPHILHEYVLNKPQNLKKKYNAEWALVTGASSGIGRALSFQLAEQGLNLVLVALPDDLLDDTTKALIEKYPSLQFRKVGTNLGSPDCVKTITDSTKDLDIQLLFNNAGYMVTRLFYDMTEDQVMNNYNCNSTVSLRLTHYYVNLLLEKKKKGAIVFTSSPAGDIPNPTASLYGSTKSFLTEFGASLAAEVKEYGIDVLVMRPSPVASRFFEKAVGTDAVNLFQKTATTPEIVATHMLASVGRCTVRDQGYYGISTKLALKVLDYNVLAFVATQLTPYLPDYKKVKKSK